MNRKEYLYIFVILSLILASYFNALSNTFVYDDIYIVSNNPNIRHLNDIPTLITTGYWHSKGHTGGLYRPLTMLSFLAEYQLVGRDPLLYHLDNILLHFIFCVLAYLFIKKILDPSGAFISAILFAAHPVHTEVVASVVGRAEMLSSVFALSSALIFLSSPKKTWKTIVSSILFFLGLLSKETAIVMPVLLFAYIAIFETEDGKGVFWRNARRLLPFAVPLTVFIFIRVAVLGGHIGPVDNETVFYNVKNYNVFLAICQVFYEYLRLSFLPFSLTIEYYFLPPESLINVKVLLPIVLLCLTVWSLLKKQPGNKVVGFATAWFFIGLLPVSNIIPIGAIMSERALYLPSLASCMLIGLLVQKAGNSIDSKRVKYFITLISVLFILFFYSVLTARRNTLWKETIFFQKMQTEELKHRIALLPDYVPLYRVLAEDYMRLNNFGQEPEDALGAALKIDPESFDVNYGFAAINLGRGLPEKALPYIQKALVARPDSPEALILECNVYMILGRYSEAEVVIDQAIRLSPDKADPYLAKGYLLMQEGDHGHAIIALRKALELDPANSKAMLQVCIILGSERDFAGALEMARRAADINPDSAEAHYFMASAYVGLGRPLDARAELQIALNIKPDYEAASMLLKRLPD